MMRPFAALLAVAVVACSHDSPMAPPPPPPASPIARLVLQDTSALVFTGAALPGQAFVAHAYDATGAEVVDPLLTLSAGTGWTVRGDTLVAPAGESRTMLHISAKRAQGASSSLVHMDVVGTQPREDVSGDSAVSDSLTVTAGIDLRTSHWTVGYMCRFPQPSVHHADDGTPADSALVTGAAVDSVVYANEVAAPDSGQDSPTWRWFRQNGALAQVWYSGTGILYRSDGKADTVAFAHDVLNLSAEAPDTLYWQGSQNAAPLASDSVTYVEGGGYVALTICADHDPTRPDTLWFTEVP